MKKHRIIAAILALFICVSVCGCKKNEGGYETDEKRVVSGEGELTPKEEIEITPETSEPETPEEEPETIDELPSADNEIASKEAMSTKFEEINSLSAEQVPWGPGTNFNSDGKPTACVMLQDDYGCYDADFVRCDEQYKGKVFLTFDEGYENGYTGAILDVLKEKGVSAVFFVTLPYVKSEPELVKRMIDEGHIVGNHTARHPNMTTVTPDEAYDEVADLHNYVKENFNYGMYLFRFPEGAFSEQTAALIQKMGYRSVFWSFAYKDWDPDNQYDADTAMKKATGSLHDGEIFLLHAVSKTNAEILGDFIDYVRNAGYTFAVYEK